MVLRCRVCRELDHDFYSCPLRGSQDKLKPVFEDSSATPDASFVPLRKKLKRKSTGKEHNFATSYYQEGADVSAMTEEEADWLRLENNIVVQGEACPKPIRHFRDLAGLPPAILTALENEGYVKPTPIQMQAIGAVMSGRDVVGNAETGSGKTLAYLLPVCSLLFHRTYSHETGPVALLIAPTRELVSQIYDEASRYLPLVTRPMAPPPVPLAVHGGVSVGAQIQALLKGVEVIVATPGRLIDLLDRRATHLQHLLILVLDEADRMLSMGMENQLRQVLDQANVVGRQTLLFSATLPIAVERLARSAVLDPLYIHVGDIGVAAQKITQEVVFMQQGQKKLKLLETLRSTEAPPVLVFCNNSHTVDKVVALLKAEQFHVAGLHSGHSQANRFKVMHALRNAGVDVVVATDVVSRGIDVLITRVIVYDMPDKIEDYVHRIGRVGRAGRHGIATAFLTIECTIAPELKLLLQAAKQNMPAELERPRQFGQSTRRDQP